MDKKEFRRLYKELYFNSQPGLNGPATLSDHDLDKLSDRVFKAFDSHGSGKLTFEEFVNAYLLLDRHSTKSSITARDRLTYILDHNNPTPGLTTEFIDKNKFVSLGFVSREHGEEIFNNLNRYYT